MTSFGSRIQKSSISGLAELIRFYSNEMDPELSDFEWYFSERASCSFIMNIHDDEWSRILGSRFRLFLLYHRLLLCSLDQCSVCYEILCSHSSIPPTLMVVVIDFWLLSFKQFLDKVPHLLGSIYLEEAPGILR